MALWQKSEVTSATGGKTSHHEWEAYGVSIDSRTVAKGDVFIAIAGENFDGHDFVKASLEKGAVAAIVSKIPAGMDETAPLILVDDTLDALIKLGAAARDRSKAKRIGVTGSVGKTSVKEAITYLLAKQGSVHSTKGNFNNHIGLPLSLSRMPRDAEFAIIEMGMNHAGELSQLTQIAKPHVAIITTVEAVHLEFFESVEKIADAKAEILEAVPTDGAAILNIDNAHFMRLYNKAQDLRIENIISFGAHEDAAFRLLSVEIKNNTQEVRAATPVGELVYGVTGLGKHHALNSLGILATIHAAGADVKKAAGDFASLPATDGRGKQYELNLNGKPFTLLNDSYNASPASMRAAFEVLAATAQDRRKVAILGEMRELGSTAPQLHQGLAGDLVKHKVDVVYCAWPLMRHLYDALPKPMQGGWVEDAAALLPLVRENIHANDVVLVKGSHGSQLWRVAEALIENKTTL